jgi:hypothetical protein
MALHLLIALCAALTISGLTGGWDSDVLRLSYESMTTPTSTIDHDIATGRRAVRKVRVPSDGWLQARTAALGMRARCPGIDFDTSFRKFAVIMADWLGCHGHFERHELEPRPGEGWPAAAYN